MSYRACRTPRFPQYKIRACSHKTRLSRRGSTVVSKYQGLGLVASFRAFRLGSYLIQNIEGLFYPQGANGTRSSTGKLPCACETIKLCPRRCSRRCVRSAVACCGLVHYLGYLDNRMCIPGPRNSIPSDAYSTIIPVFCQSLWYWSLDRDRICASSSYCVHFTGRPMPLELLDKRLPCHARSHRFGWHLPCDRH